MTNNSSKKGLGTRLGAVAVAAAALLGGLGKGEATDMPSSNKTPVVSIIPDPDGDIYAVNIGGKKVILDENMKKNLELLSEGFSKDDTPTERSEKLLKNIDKVKKG